MNGLAELALILGGAFAVSYGVAFLLVKARKPRFPEIPDGAKVTLRGVNGTQRTRLVGVVSSGVVIQAPLEDDRYVPIRVGESIRVEIPLEEALLRFRTDVTERDSETHLITLAIPSSFVLSDRREKVRRNFSEEQPARLNGEPALLLDLSENGACVVAAAELAVGDLTRLEVEGRTERYGCVLEVTPDILDGRFATRARLLFS